MKHSLLLSLIALALSGCLAPDRNGSSNASAVGPGFHREADKSFSSRERDMILAARNHLAHSVKRPKDVTDDAFYRVRRNADGYDIFIVYVTGYENGKPVFTPCMHNEVFVRPDGSVSKVLVGPECWPRP